MPPVSQKENDYQHEHMAHSARLGTSYKGTLKCCSLWWGGKFWAQLEPSIAGGCEIISHMTRIRNCLVGVCCSMRYLQTLCQESAQMVIKSYLYGLIGNMQGSQRITWSWSQISKANLLYPSHSSRSDPNLPTCQSGPPTLEDVTKSWAEDSINFIHSAWFYEKEWGPAGWNPSRTFQR